MQCVDRHGREDKTHIFVNILCIFIAYYLFVPTNAHVHWLVQINNRQDAYLCSVWTDIVTRTGHLFEQCVDRHGHKDRTLICAVCGQT